MNINNTQGNPRYYLKITCDADLSIDENVDSMPTSVVQFSHPQLFPELYPGQQYCDLDYQLDQLQASPSTTRNCIDAFSVYGLRLAQQ